MRADEMAAKFAAAVNGKDLAARAVGSRVYLKFPKGFQGGCGGGKIGHIEFAAPVPVKSIDWASVTDVARAAIKSALA